MKKFYVTTSIVYSNAKPHIGFALELVQADVIAMYNELLKKDVYFLTGTDDHGIKIAQTAKKTGKTPKKFIQENIKAYKELVQKLNISNSDFISTSDVKKHWSGAIAMWKALDKSKDIYMKSYKGLYCSGCEAFLTEKDLVDGKCPDHQKKPEIIKEKNYFFRVTKYTSKIRELIIKNELKIIPVEKKNEILNIIDEFEDISFSRLRKKLTWGIPVPGDNSQMMYVWCDALTNYISALGYGQQNNKKFKKYWPADVHCIGKDILKFHAIVWPAMLLSAGIDLPKQIFVHGHITSGGKKMSKSLGNVIDPFEIIKIYGTDPMRYYLLREIPAVKDGDFDYDRFTKVYNSDLANDLGNLINRAIKMARKFNLKLTKYQNSQIISLDKYFEDYSFEKSLDFIWFKIRQVNKNIEEEKPWEYAKKDSVKLKKFFEKIFSQIQSIALTLKPFLPETSQKIQKQLNTLKPEVLFPKIK